MKKRTGFTLIELLAVIVILGIILLIAFPLIANLISNVKEGVAEKNAQAFVKHLQTQVSAEESLETKDILEEGQVNDKNKEKVLVDRAPDTVCTLIGDDFKINGKVSYDGFYFEINNDKVSVIDIETYKSIYSECDVTSWSFRIDFTNGGYNYRGYYSNTNFTFLVENPNMTIDWGDGSPIEEARGLGLSQITHEYSTTDGIDVYDIILDGTAEAIKFSGMGDDTGEGEAVYIPKSNELAFAGELADITFSDLDYRTTEYLLDDILTPIPVSMGLSKADYMFTGTNLSTITAPNFFDEASAFITSMSYMFYGTPEFNENISNWDVSNVTNMRYMFANTDLFNQNINSWNTANVTDMSGMFSSASDFNQPLNNWDVSKVTDISWMFDSAYSFGQDINDWNTSSVTNMEGTFYSAYDFAGHLDKWDTANVTDMSDMFSKASWWNESDIGNWDTSNVTDMSYMFAENYFNFDISSWDVSNVTNMRRMFYQNTDFNQPLDTWDVSKVENMNSMFSETWSFNQPLNNWNTSNVTDMSYMFSDSIFNQPINNWNTSNVTDMQNMFRYSEFNQPLNTWDVSNVTNMSYMFSSSSFNHPLDNWDVSNVWYMSNMFSYSDLNQDLSSWTPLNISSMPYRFDHYASDWVLPRPPFGSMVEDGVAYKKISFPGYDDSSASFTVGANSIAVGTNGQISLATDPNNIDLNFISYYYSGQLFSDYINNPEELLIAPLWADYKIISSNSNSGIYYATNNDVVTIYFRNIHEYGTSTSALISYKVIINTTTLDVSLVVNKVPSALFLPGAHEFGNFVIRNNQAYLFDPTGFVLDQTYQLTTPENLSDAEPTDPGAGGGEAW